MIDVIYLIGFIGGMALFVPKMTNSWWEAQGRQEPFEFSGAVWVLLGSGFFAAFWPVSLPIALGALVFQRLINQRVSAEKESTE